MNIYGNDGYNGKYRSFFFYGSFREALEALDDVELRNEAAWAVIRCGTEENIPDNVSPTIRALLMTIRPLMDNSRERYAKKIKNHEEWKRSREKKPHDTEV